MVVGVVVIYQRGQKRQEMGSCAENKKSDIKSERAREGEYVCDGT